MRSKVVRASAALFMATAAFVPAHLASASPSKKDAAATSARPIRRCSIRSRHGSWSSGRFSATRRRPTRRCRARSNCSRSLALLSDSDLCLTLTGGDGGGGGDTTTTSDDDGHDKIDICYVPGNPNHPYVEISVDENGFERSRR